MFSYFSANDSTFTTKVTNACNDEEQDSILFFDTPYIFKEDSYD